MSDSDSQSYLGIDLSQEWLDACLLPERTTWHVSTQAVDLNAWVEQLPSTISLAVLEATGGLETSVASLLHQRGIAVSIVNPRRIRSFASSCGMVAKTDQLDAYAIALFAQRVQPPVREFADEDQHEFAEIMTRRRQVMESLQAEKCRLARVRSKAVRQDLKDHIRWLEKRLSKFETELDRLVKSKNLWKEQEEQMMSVPGVGKITAQSIIAQLPEIGKLSRKQIASLVGVAPFCRVSGKWKGRSMISDGRRDVRRTLYMAALVAKQHNPVIQQFALRLQAQGKAAKVVLVACMRKLLVILNALLRDQCKWQIN